VERAVAFETGEWITPESLPPRVVEAFHRGDLGPDGRDPGVETLGPGFTLDQYIERIERHHLNEALRAAGGSVTKAAERLGLSFRSMRYKLAKYGIRR